MAEALHDGELDTVWAEDERTMIAESQVNRFDERVEESVLVQHMLLGEKALRRDSGEVCSGRINTEAPARISKFSSRVVSGSPFSEPSTLSTEKVTPVAPERLADSSARTGLALRSAKLCITAVFSLGGSFSRKEVAVGLRSLSKRDWKWSSICHLSVCILTRRTTNTTSGGIEFRKSE
jgi:hypothetical protein